MKKTKLPPARETRTFGRHPRHQHKDDVPPLVAYFIMWLVVVIIVVLLGFGVIGEK